MHSILVPISGWGPFQIDALGLVTIFGAKEMNTSIGNLTQSWVTEWLPVLGSYAVANNEIGDMEHGYVLYNITDGVMSTDVAAWFTRWLSSFKPTYASTVIRLEMDGKSLPLTRKLIALAIGVSTISLSLSFAVLTADPWGIANSIAMCGQVLVRQHMVGQLRECMNKTIVNLDDKPSDDVKAFLTLPDGKAVTILGPRQVVVDCIITDARPLNTQHYFFARVIGWGLFAAHAIALGMSNLFNQMLTVAIMLLATYLTATRVGYSSQMIGTRLRLDIDTGDPSWTRSPAYARFDLTPDEEEKMVHWSLMPHRSNTFWWNRYYRRSYAISSTTNTRNRERRFVEEWKQVSRETNRSLSF